MRKIKNIHLNDDPEVYQCFGCSPYNEFGLHLEFWEDADEVVSFWNPSPILQSYPKVLHGGIQSTLLDEIAGWVVYVKCGTVGVTAEMKVRFKKPLMIDQGEITIRAKLLGQKQTNGNHSIATDQFIRNCLCRGGTSFLSLVRNRSS